MKAGRALMGVIVLFIVLAVRLLYPQMFLGNMYFPIPDWIMRIYAGGMITVFIVIIRHHLIKK